MSGQPAMRQPAVHSTRRGDIPSSGFPSVVSAGAILQRERIYEILELETDYALPFCKQKVRVYLVKNISPKLNVYTWNSTFYLCV